MFLLVPAHPGSPGQTAVKRLLLCCCVLQTVNGTDTGVEELESRNNAASIRSPAVDEERMRSDQWLGSVV